MDGLSGFNVRTLGVSRDNAMHDIARLKPAFMLVHDDPELAAMCASVGIRVVYRASGDDPAGRPLSQDPAAFVQARANVAPSAAFVHLTNEVDPPNADLYRWTRDAMDYAERTNRRVCIYNYGTNKSREAWLEGRDNLRRAAERGHAIGAHFYPDGEHDAGGLEFLSVKREVGGLWLLTEFAYIQTIFDANRGWRGALPVDAYRAFMRQWSAFFAAEQVPLLWFSYDHWPHNDDGRASGFGFHDTNALLQDLASMNRMHTFKGVPSVTWQTHDFGTRKDGFKARVSQTINVRAEPSTSAAVVGSLADGASVSYWDKPYQGTPYKWYKILHGGREAFVAEVSGLRFEAAAPVPAPEGVTLTAAQWQKVQEAASILVALAQEVKPEQSGGF